MDLGGWLRSLGLEQYEAAFRANAIDETVLHDLTEDPLGEIGIPLGARLKLLKAIAALGTRAEATRPSADAEESKAKKSIADDNNHEESDNNHEEEEERLEGSKRRRLSLSADRCENQGAE